MNRNVLILGLAATALVLYLVFKKPATTVAGSAVGTTSAQGLTGITSKPNTPVAVVSSIEDTLSKLIPSLFGPAATVIPVSSNSGIATNQRAAFMNTQLAAGSPQQPITVEPTGISDLIDVSPIEITSSPVIQSLQDTSDNYVLASVPAYAPSAGSESSNVDDLLYNEAI